MQIIDLYRYEENNGVVTITPNKRNETDTPSRARLVADEGATLVKDEIETEVVDVMLDEVEQWAEINALNEATATDYINALEEKAAAYDVLMGGGASK